MFYDNGFIDELEKSPHLTIPKEIFVETQVRNVIKMLEDKREYYKQFGVYWWAVKDAIRELLVHSLPDKEKPWYAGNADDPLMKERAWHGADRTSGQFRTFLAAMYYMNEQLDFGSVHSWFDKDGEEHSYTLFDPDAGV